MNHSKIRIVFVLDSLGFGGREKVVVDLVNGLDINKFDVYVISYSNDSTEQAALINPNVTVICLPFTRSSLGSIGAVRFWAKGLGLFISHLRKIDPNIVHTHLLFQQFLFGSVGIKLARIKAKHFHTVHTAGLYFANNSFLNRCRLSVEKIAVRINHVHIIAVSEVVRQNCLQAFGKAACAVNYIPNGVDSRRFNVGLRQKLRKAEFKLNDSDIVVIYVARMDHGKDHITLLRAWKIVAKPDKRLKLLLIGDGPLRNELQNFVLENQLADSVMFLGVQQHVERILAIADLAAFPSLFEGLPISLLEIMFMKVPVIATAIDPVKFIVHDKVTGLLFQPKDYEALAADMIRLIEDRRLRESIAENAYDFVQQFGLDITIRKHIDLYEVSANN